MTTTIDEVILRKPTKVKIDQITTNMVAQVQTRSMSHRPDGNKASSMFIKKNEPKKVEIVKPKDTLVVKIKTVHKKWKPKKANVTKVPKAQTNDSTRVEEKVSKVTITNDKKN